MQIIQNDGAELGKKLCPNCLKAQYPFDPTKEEDAEDTRTEIDEPEGELMMYPPPPEGKMNLVLPKLLSSRFSGLEDTNASSLFKGFGTSTADIPSKGVVLPPIKSPEELLRAEQERLERNADNVKDRPKREWPEPGETREQWKERQKQMRITWDNILNDEWEGFTYLLRKQQEQLHPTRKIAIPRPRKSQWQ
jgi:hypothetical protein